MIDFHCHVLPGMDDGSKSVEESLRMLEAQRQQGIRTVIATSHFYAEYASPKEFLSRRRKAWDTLRGELPESAPEVILGAEVYYFPGISRSDALSALCAEGTNLLLLEMPFHRWPENMIREIRDIADSGEFTLVMAHMERYYSYQRRSVWDELRGDGVVMQSNADFFLPFRTRRKAVKLLREHTIRLLGTDCHNMDSRRPRMDEALETIRSQLGESAVSQLKHYGRSLLEEAAL